MITEGAKLVRKTKRMNKFEIILFQLLNYCFNEKVKLNHTELDCLAYLGELGKVRLTDFSNKAVEKGILGSSTAVTNYIGRLEKMGFVAKDGVGKKVISLAPKLGIHSEGNVVIQLTLIKLDETKATGKPVQANSRKPELAAEVH